MAESRTVFGTITRERIRTSESGINHSTLKPGRLIRVGVLTIKTDADTQFDLLSPDRTVIADPKDVKEKVIDDETYGLSRWRLVTVKRSNDSRLKGRSVWIGWERNDRGELTQPIMHPELRAERPTLGLDKL